MSLIIIDGDLPQVPADPIVRCRRLVVAGSALVGVFVIGFGVWAAFAPLESAVVAPGTVVSQSHRKTLQHLEGGIIKDILVKDGDAVVAGQTLIQLDDTKARTTFLASQAELWDARAADARLVAERDGSDRIDFPADLLDQRVTPAAAQALAGQQKIFDSWKELETSKIDAIHERINQSQAEIAGLKAEATSDDQRIALLSQEIASVSKLVTEGLERMPRLLELRRDLADSQGKRGDAVAEIARAKETIAEADVNILSLQNDDRERAASDLGDTERRVHDLDEQTQAAAAVLARTNVTAPEAGTVTDLRVHTPGGVIGPGEPILDLVPASDPLVIEAQVSPIDVDRLRDGLSAEVRLLPYRSRRVPPLDATVTYVSADQLVDQATHKSYFEVKLAVDPAQLKGQSEVKLIPGMPAEAMIKTGKSTVALYALSPLVDDFHRAFREKD